MDVVADMKAVEAQIGGRVGDAIAGAKAKGSGLGNKLRGLFAKAKIYLGGMSMTVIAIVAVLAVAALSSPIAIWSAYHSGKAVEAEREHAADAKAVADQAVRDKAAIARESTKLAKADAVDRAEIAKLRRIAAKLAPKTKLCPPAVYDVIHGFGGYTLIPGRE